MPCNALIFFYFPGFWSRSFRRLVACNRQRYCSGGLSNYGSLEYQYAGESGALTQLAQPMNNNILSSSGDVTVESLQEGQNFTSSMNSALGLDSDWNMVAELSAGIPSEHTLPGSTSMTAINDIAHQSSSTCPMKLSDLRKSLVDDSSKSGTNETCNNLAMNSVAPRALRSKCGQKRDRCAAHRFHPMSPLNIYGWIIQVTFIQKKHVQMICLPAYPWS